eukprot:scaffold17925_cov56-Attheya_sp.AAC.8
MGAGVGKIGPEKVSEPNRMAPNNHVVFCHIISKDMVTKSVHSFEAIRIDWFVANMETHVYLVVENILKVAHFAVTINPRGCHLLVRRSDGECIRIARNFLQAGLHENLFFRALGQSFAKGPGHGRKGSSQTGTKQMTPRRSGISTQDFHQFFFGWIQRFQRFFRL